MLYLKKACHYLLKPFVFFSIILLLKSYLAWSVLFDSGSALNILLTEMPFIWILFCIVEWLATKRKLTIYLTINLAVTGLFFAVVMYYKYYGVIATYHALEQVNQVTAVKNSVFSLLQPYYLFLFTDVLVIGFYLIRSKHAEAWKTLAAKKERRGVVTALFALSLFLCMFNILPNRASMSELKKAEQMGIIGYEAYTLLADEEKQVPVPVTEITQDTVNQLKGTQPAAAVPPQLQAAAKGRNVIVIQMESLQNFLINLRVNGQEITPNLNRLAGENFYFNHFYQQVGQGNTSDAEFVVNTSMYIPRRGAATMSYVDYDLPSLPKLFKAQGYDTATFHTNVVEFWNRNNLYRALGFDRYYDQSYFGTEDTVFFGPKDEVLYEKTSAELARMQESGRPFYAHVISMTAHHPYTTPAELDQITLPEEYQDNFVGDYLRAQSYADYALGQFIDELKASGVYDNSLILIYGDHVGLPIYSLKKNEVELLEGLVGREYSFSDMFNVPLMVIAPGITYPSVFEQMGGQVDVLPTIANLAGLSLADQLHFGQDLFNTTRNLLPERYYLPTGSLIGPNALFIPGSGYEDGTQYPLADGLIREDGVTRSEYERALELLNLSDSYVTQLPRLEPEGSLEDTQPASSGSPAATVSPSSPNR
ncbi:LTA synthase family protein [Gorillibacterium sp. CAU 1737]|uniref:LTA synthase family protein n=1 Tax=Gorillibacterium sp. CAU 1737 TaxID=3140362 RepID=UPI00325FFB5C